MASEPTAQEQLLLELINRERLDPAAEAARLAIDLNDGLAAGTISTSTKAPLAFNTALIDAARGHSAWMLETDSFSHTGISGTQPKDRMEEAGYSFTGSWSARENIGVLSTTGSIDLTTTMAQHVAGLFLSANHRVNTLAEDVREIGIGELQGVFTSDGVDYNTSMLTENFALSGTTVFVTGVLYTDSDSNAFYSIGEGIGGQTVAVGSRQTDSWGSGGYTVALAAGGDYAFATGTVALTAHVGAENAKIDVIDGDRVATSVSVTLETGVREATLLGRDDLSLTGSALAELLIGNAGFNAISGGAGNDTLMGGVGRDTLDGGPGTDTVSYAAASAAVVATTAGGTGGEAGGDVHISIENLIGSAFNDRLTGDAGPNRLSGGDGRDTLDGGVGNDTLLGGAGNDRISGSRGIDRLQGDAGNDSLYGGLDRDQLWGGTGNDRLYGNGGNDRLLGDAGNDSLYGSIGNDSLLGGAGNDRLYGDAGNDTLIGGAGKDVLTGGSGRDRFVFTGADDGRDTVRDFRSGTDKLAIDHDGYDGMTTGAFRLVMSHTPVATTGLQTLLFDTDSHQLLVDADGTGSGQAVLVTILDGVSTLKVSDILIV